MEAIHAEPQHWMISNRDTERFRRRGQKNLSR
jgi:hypothetical protein